MNSRALVIFSKTTCPYCEYVCHLFSLWRASFRFIYSLIFSSRYCFSQKADSKCVSSRCFWCREAKTIFQQELGAAYASVKVIARHYLSPSSTTARATFLINIFYLVDVSSALLLFDAEKRISEQTAVYRSLSWIKWAAKPPGSLRYIPRTNHSRLQQNLNSKKTVTHLVDIYMSSRGLASSRHPGGYTSRGSSMYRDTYYPYYRING